MPAFMTGFKDGGQVIVPVPLEFTGLNLPRFVASPIMTSPIVAVDRAAVHCGSSKRGSKTIYYLTHGDWGEVCVSLNNSRMHFLKNKTSIFYIVFYFQGI
jgi:hypothetical protein